MKLLLLFVMVLSNFISIAQENNFLFILKINGLKIGKYPVSVRINNSIKGDTLIFTDTISPEKNQVIIRNYVKEEYFIDFQIKKVGMFACAIGPNDSIFLELTAGNFSENFIAKGSKRPVVMANYFFKHFLKQAIELQKKQHTIDSLALNNNANNQIAKERKSYDSLSDSYYRYNIDFADTTPSAVSLSFALFKYLDNQDIYEIYPSIEKAIYRFGNIVPINSLVVDYNFRKTEKTAFSEGDILPLISIFNKQHYRDIRSIAKKNRLVLIDFWASWCAPCREEFPYINDAYKKFKDKGFDIISVSLDKNEIAWRKALQVTNNSWKNNYLDKNEWNSKAVKILNIKSIPRNYLIDGHGKIYAKDIRGVEIVEVLKKLL